MNGLDHGHVGPAGLHVVPIGFIVHQAAVSRALQEVNSGYRREALYFLHGEDRGAVHHAVNHEPVLAGINIRDMIIVHNNEMVRGRRDDSDRILKRSQIS